MRNLARVAGTLVLALFALSAVTAQDKPTGPARQRKDFKPQSELAAKTAFQTVKANDAAVKKALDAKELAAAGKLVGKEGAFKGTVSKVFSAKGNSVVVLDFAPNFKEALTAVVKPDSYARFPDLNQLKDKKVLVSGKFEDFKGAPQIVLEKPEQIKLIR